MEYKLKPTPYYVAYDANGVALYSCVFGPEEYFKQYPTVAYLIKVYPKSGRY